MAEALVVGSKVKAAVKKAGCNCGGDFVDALSKCTEGCISSAVKRCKANGRKTVRACDL